MNAGSPSGKGMEREMKPIVKLVMVTLEHTTLVFLPPLHRFKLGMGLECRGCFLFHHQHLTVHGIHGVWSCGAPCWELSSAHRPELTLPSPRSDSLPVPFGINTSLSASRGKYTMYRTG